MNTLVLIIHGNAKLIRYARVNYSQRNPSALTKVGTAKQTKLLLCPQGPPTNYK